MTKLQLSLIIVLLSTTSVQAGVRTASDGGGQMVAKLQAMVRQANKERDVFKTENAKLKAEVDALGKEKAELSAEYKKISKRLAGEKSNRLRLQTRQDQTFARLEEVVEKYKGLNQKKNQLLLDLKGMTGNYHQVSSQLNQCDQNNHKLIESAKELLSRYQNKGTITSLFQSEGVLQFQSVEMENIVQDYEDKIVEQEYNKTATLVK